MAYTIGIDAGVASGGFVLTDEDGRILNVGGRDMLGVVRCREASTSEKKRERTIARRRLDRIKIYKKLVRGYFAPEIEKVDKAFFTRLENSKYFLEDKDGDIKTNIKTKNILFDDENYDDSLYYTKYPTVSHLRKELIHNPEPHDIRLVFISIYSMFGHRGHFLYSGLAGIRKFSDIYFEFCDMLADDFGISFPKDIDMEELMNIITNNRCKKKEKEEKVCEYLSIDKADKRKKLFIKAICGMSVKVNKLFPDTGEAGDADICFSDYGYDEKIPDIMNASGDYYAVIELMKDLYDSIILAGIIGNHTYLSEARVDSYQKHKADKKLLQDLYRRYKTQEEYKAMFRGHGGNSYSSYINSCNSSRIKTRRGMKPKKDKKDGNKDKDKMFFDYITKEFEAYSYDEDVADMLLEIENNIFLPKQLTKMNGVIPNQVHAAEMEKILHNAERYLPFLKEKDETGLTVSERILALFTFHVPYYVGPVGKGSRTGWASTYGSGPLLPWNLTERVDIWETAERFITTNIRHCTYIDNEKVLPKSSIQYSKYCVLNEINSIKVKGMDIDVSIKQEIYGKLFKDGKKVTKAKIAALLAEHGLAGDKHDITGISDPVGSTCSSYSKFKKVFGSKLDGIEYMEMAEDIIFYHTVYGHSKALLNIWLERKYGDVLTENQKTQILRMKFSGWGKLSPAFLNLCGTDKETGRTCSIMDALWDTNMNLMELIHSDRYTFNEEIEKTGKKHLPLLKYIQIEDLDSYYFSAPVKSMIWNILKMLKEQVRIMGENPECICIEMTRENNKNKKGKKTKSRKEKFLDLYKKHGTKEEKEYWKKVIEKADEDGLLKTDKMYLYLSQKGMCMYTGEKIDLSTVFNNNVCDKDHIGAKSITGDNGLDSNCVLVKKSENGYKSDGMLKPGIRKKMHGVWKSLLKDGFISEKKYDSLMRSKPWTDDQKAGFIARQLTETGQIAKGIADILKQVLPGTKIIYSKASNVSKFRKEFGIDKCRNLNEFHHAYDAYLNVIVGRAYDTKFTQNPVHFIKKECRNSHYDLSNIFKHDIGRNGKTVWVAGENGTIATVREEMKKIPMVSMATHEGHGKLTKETIAGHVAAGKNAKNYLPVKSSDERLCNVSRYGGYTGASIAYFFLVEHTVGRKRERRLETVPVYLKEKIENMPDGLMYYCKDILHLKEPDIRIKKINLMSQVKFNGYDVYISGQSTGSIVVWNATQLHVPEEWIPYISRLEKFAETKKLNKSIVPEKNSKLYDFLVSKYSGNIFAKRKGLDASKIADAKENFLLLPLKKQCEALNQIMKIASFGAAAYGDLKSIGINASYFGKLTFSKNISNYDEVILVNKSVTGFYENTVNLLAI